MFGHLQILEWLGFQYRPSDSAVAVGISLASDFSLDIDLIGWEDTLSRFDQPVNAVSGSRSWLSIHVNQGERLKREGSVISVRERELLVLRAQTGDREALNVLFESCRGRLYYQALRILTRPQDAEDAVQEAMLAAFAHLRRFQRGADFLTWATRIVINAALQHVRKTRTKPTVPWDQVDTEFEGPSFTEYLRDPQPTPEELLARLEQQEMLENALHKLPVEMRRAIQLCKSTDYSLKEVASALGLPVSTLKARLHRGRRALMVRLKRQTQVRRRPSANSPSSQICPASEESFSPALTASGQV